MKKLKSLIKKAFSLGAEAGYKSIGFVWRRLWTVLGVCYFPVFLALKLSEWVFRALIALCYLLTFESDNAYIMYHGLFRVRGTKKSDMEEINDDRSRD